MGELPSRESLEMSLLLFTLISTALAMPAHDCPPFPPADCGEGMRSCPGDTDPMGARCLRSALLRETSAHSSVHMSSTPTADLSCPTVLDPSTQTAARPL